MNYFPDVDFGARISALIAVGTYIGAPSLPSQSTPNSNFHCTYWINQFNTKVGLPAYGNVDYTHFTQALNDIIHAGGGGVEVTQPPVVGDGSFHVTLPTSVGTPVGTMGASNSPTAWAITSGNGNNYYAINSATGAIIVTSAGAAGITAGSLSMGISATNSAGVGYGQAVISVS